MPVFGEYKLPIPKKFGKHVSNIWSLPVKAARGEEYPAAAAATSINVLSAVKRDRESEGGRRRRDGSGRLMYKYKLREALAWQLCQHFAKPKENFFELEVGRRRGERSKRLPPQRDNLLTPGKPFEKWILPPPPTDEEQVIPARNQLEWERENGRGIQRRFLLLMLNGHPLFSESYPLPRFTP